MAIYTTPTGGTDVVTTPVAVSPIKSTASIVAILAAVGSFVLTFGYNHKIWAVAAAVVAVVAGLIGAAKAVSPYISGGILSLAAIALGAIALLVALLGIVIPGV